MIIKQPDKIISDDKFSKAGYDAEKQMAFYLHRAFADEKYIAVLNGIRLRKGIDVCQMDHLIVHEFGIVIIESKSVTSKIKINEDGSWERLWNDNYTGMPSPVLQAERQADFLRSYLNDHKEQLLKKVFGFQHSFQKLPIETIVAISDKGRIDRSQHSENKSVYKADQVAGKIKDIYATQKRLDNPLTITLKVADWRFHKASMQNFIDFLMKNHCPVAKKNKEVTKPVEYKTKESIQDVPQVQEKHAEYGIKMQTSTCPECSQQMEIWSKYGYFWKCTACGKTVAIKESCPHCNGKLKVRKQKNKYFIGCKECNIEGLYHEVQ